MQFESATSLIQAAKNLMSSVVLTVKESYIASTKYRNQNDRSAVVRWQMRAPEKKPLVTQIYSKRTALGYLMKDDSIGSQPDVLDELSRFQHSSSR